MWLYADLITCLDIQSLHMHTTSENTVSPSWSRKAQMRPLTSKASGRDKILGQYLALSTLLGFLGTPGPFFMFS